MKDLYRDGSTILATEQLRSPKHLLVKKKKKEENLYILETTKEAKSP
jgi:hypothetical protein